MRLNEWSMSSISCILGGVNGWMQMYLSLPKCDGPLWLHATALLVVWPVVRIRPTKFWHMISMGICEYEMDKQLSWTQFEMMLKRIACDWLKSFMLRLSSLTVRSVLSIVDVFKKAMSVESSRQSCRFRYSSGCMRPRSSENNRERRKLNDKSIFFSLYERLSVLFMRRHTSFISSFE